RYALRRGRHCSHARRAGNRPEKVIVQSGAIHLQFPILSRSPVLPGTLAGTRRGKLGFNAWRNAMNISRIRPAKLGAAMLAGSLALSVLIGPAFVPPNMGGSVARAEVSIGIDVFQRDLSPYGQWVDSPNYGQVWYPVGVQQGWRPYYNDGHWEYSDDYGWIWVSDLPWGWAAFHYGRWAFDPNYGWVWVPGYVWAPAWVTFRSAPGYVGWAPLPPYAEWDDDYGFRGRYDIDDARYWCFVRPEGFLAPRFDRYVYDRRDYP